MLKIGIMGAGAFGTSLAISYSKSAEVVLFSYFEDHVQSMNEDRHNEFFKEFEIPPQVSIDVVNQVKYLEFDYILWCFPVRPTTKILAEVSHYICNMPVIICSKGFSCNGEFLSDEFEKNLQHKNIAVLSGPNFAIDLAQGKMSAADLAMDDFESASKIASDLSLTNFKLLPSNDLKGVQIAGAIKNVIAIACGIVTGLHGGQNTLSAILTFGLWEMIKFGEALGANKDTFFGLSGVGDLMLTASSDTSRNMSFGKRIATDFGDIEGILSNSHVVCEGAGAVKQIIDIANRHKIQLKLCNYVFDIIYNNKNPQTIFDIFNDS